MSGSCARSTLACSSCASHVFTDARPGRCRWARWSEPVLDPTLVIRRKLRIELRIHRDEVAQLLGRYANVEIAGDWRNCCARHPRRKHCPTCGRKACDPPFVEKITTALTLSSQSDSSNSLALPRSISISILIRSVAEAAIVTRATAAARASDPRRPCPECRAAICRRSWTFAPRSAVMGRGFPSTTC